MKTSTLPNILLVDDGDDTRLLTKWFLSNLGYSVDAARGVVEALELFNPKVHDIIITDNSMEGMTGVEMAHIIKLRSPSTPIIMYTGNPPEDQSCIDLVLQRPSHLLELKTAIDTVVTHHHEP